MTLRCPHCGEASTHQRRNVLGHFVICPECNRHFEWERALPSEKKAEQVQRDGEWDEEALQES